MSQEQIPESAMYRIEPRYLIDKLVSTGLTQDEAIATIARMGVGNEEATQAVMRAADLVQTKVGMVPREKLVVSHVQDESDTAFEAATEFYLEGELVRRDAWVNMKRGLSMGAAQAQI